MTNKTFLISMILMLFAADLVFAEAVSSEPTAAPKVGEAAPKAELADGTQTRKKHNQHSRGEKRIYKASMRPDVIYRLQTALGFTSTIDLPESAQKVFVGDQELFKVGVYEKEVVIKPITDDPDARTNLTIVTNSSRLSFDVSVGSPDTADFVLDFRLREEDSLVDNAFKTRVDEAETKLKETYEKKEKDLDQKAKKISEEKLKEEVKKGNEQISLKSSKEAGEIRVNLISFSTIGDKAYLRFGVRNLSASPYKVREVVIGVQTYEKKTLGLQKEKEGIIEIHSELTLENPIPASSYQYGVLQFERRALKKGEKPVFLIFEEGGTQNIKIEGFHWLD